MPIVCDTNIWYALADGRIKPEEVVGKNLVGTFVSGYEFCSSRNMYRDFNRLKLAVRAFSKYSQFCYGGSPIEHIKMISNYEWDRSGWENIEIMLNAIVMSDLSPNNDLARELFGGYIDEMNLKDQPFQDIICQYREGIKFKGAYKKKMNEPEFRAFHKEQTKELLSEVHQGVTINWDMIELYVSTFDEWFRQLSLQPNLIMNLNDWNDLSNLVYVKPGNLYWTGEKKRTTEFINNCGCSHYLYKTE